MTVFELQTICAEASTLETVLQPLPFLQSFTWSVLFMLKSNCVHHFMKHCVDIIATPLI